jgi:hypothetical protein
MLESIEFEGTFPMGRTSKLLCMFYALVAVAALYGTWSENLQYGSPATAGAQFLTDLKVNPASRSISIDLSLFLLAASVWMVLEARRIGLRFVWAYVVFAFLVAISVTFPLYLLAREIRLASPAPVATPSRLVVVLDYAGLAIVSALLGSLSIWLHGAASRL